MKSVLISTRPRWCEKIASGEKTVEVRKTRPKLQPPFKVYIYCTIGDGAKGDILPQSRVTCGKVIGEFVCDRIEEIGFSPEMHGQYICRDQSFIEQSCVPFDEMFDYLDEEYGYGWHISGLVIYDTPRPLAAFCKCGTETLEELLDREGLCQYCSDTGYGKYATYGSPNGHVMCEGRFCDKAYQEYLDENFALTRPPQSWCYVEEVTT